MWEWYRRYRWLRWSTLDRCNKAVPMARDRFNETGSGRRIPECASQLSNRRIDALIEVDKVAVRPKTAAYFFTTDQLTGPLEQHRKKTERLILKMKTLSAFVELALGQASLKGPEHDA
jgi:hypothetical protein